MKAFKSYTPKTNFRHQYHILLSLYDHNLQPTDLKFIRCFHYPINLQLSKLSIQKLSSGNQISSKNFYFMKSMWPWPLTFSLRNQMVSSLPHKPSTTQVWWYSMKAIKSYAQETNVRLTDGWKANSILPHFCKRRGTIKMKSQYNCVDNERSHYQMYPPYLPHYLTLLLFHSFQRFIKNQSAVCTFF